MRSGAPEALHDLRISLRRLDHYTATLLQHSNPLRDFEVLIADLRTHHAPGATTARKHQLDEALQGFANSDELLYLQESRAEWQLNIVTKKLPSSGP